MSRPGGNFKRSRYLVAKRIQYRFAFFVMAFVFIISFLSSLIVFFSILTVLGDKLAAVYPQGRLAPIIQSTYLAFGIIQVLTLPAIIFVSIRFSHRIVGPLEKIYQYLRSVGQGIYPGVLRIRQKDELQDLAKEINSMATQLKNRGSIKET